MTSYFAKAGTKGGDGSQAKPFGSLNELFRLGGPGVTLIAEGDFCENVSIAAGRGGTKDRPCVLLAFGATLEALNPRAVALKGLGLDNLVLIGLEIKGGLHGVQFTQKGRDFSNPCSNIALLWMRFKGQSADGAKFAQTKGALVIGCDIYGAGEEAVDFVNVQDGGMFWTSIRNNQGGFAFAAKTGSERIVTAFNTLSDCQSGIVGGGFGGHEVETVEQWQGWHVRQMAVTFNNYLRCNRGTVMAGAIDSYVGPNTTVDVNKPVAIIEGGYLKQPVPSKNVQVVE